MLLILTRRQLEDALEFAKKHPGINGSPSKFVLNHTRSSSHYDTKQSVYFIYEQGDLVSKTNPTILRAD